MRCPIGIYATPSSLATVGRKAYRFRQADFLIFKSIPAPISLATWFLKFSRSRNPVALSLSRNCGSLIIKLVVMLHRHLNHQGFTLAAIDDIISRGGWRDWADLRRAVLEDQSLLDKVERVCLVRVSDPYAQRYHFWMHYVEEHRSPA